MRGGSPKKTDDKPQFQSFNTRVLQGYLLCSATRALTERDGGGVLSLDEACTKAGRLVLDILQAKNPELWDPHVAALETDSYLDNNDAPDSGAFESYENTPTVLPVTITADVVEEVAAKL